MMSRTLLIVFAVLGAGVTCSKKAEEQKSARLIEPTELQDRLNEAGLRILDTRSNQAYAKSHISGAAWVNVASWKELGQSEGGVKVRPNWSTPVRVKLVHLDRLERPGIAQVESRRKNRSFRSGKTGCSVRVKLVHLVLRAKPARKTAARSAGLSLYQTGQDVRWSGYSSSAPQSEARGSPVSDDLASTWTWTTSGIKPLETNSPLAQDAFFFPGGLRYEWPSMTTTWE